MTKLSSDNNDTTKHHRDLSILLEIYFTMSDATKIRISIGKRVFNDYPPLVEYMKVLLVEYMAKNRTLKGKDFIKSLMKLKEQLIFGKNKEIYKFLQKRDFAKECTNLMKYCLEKEDMEVYSALLSVMITITDNSKEMCEALMKNDLSSLLIDHTIQICNDNSKIKLPKGITVKIMFDKLILIIDNIAKDTKFQTPFRTSANIELLKDIVLPFTKSNDHRTRILTLAALTWVLSEKYHPEFDLYSNIIDNYVTYIARALNDKSRRCEGLRILEMLAVLKSLSNIQTIKCVMLQNKPLMSLLGDILKSTKSDDEEIEMTLSIVYHLSFKHEDYRQSLEDVFNKEVYVKPFLNNRNDKIRKNAQGIMSELKQNVENKEFNIPERSRSEIIHDIYMNYCNCDEEKMDKIADSLTRKKFIIVVKEEDIEDAKKSIDKTSMLILGLTNTFYNDTECHAKCNHARALKIPIISIILEEKYVPDDWLKEFTNNNTSIDISNDEEFDLKIKEIVQKVEAIFVEMGLSKAKLPEPEMKAMSINSSFIDEKPLREWTDEEVYQWLKLKELSHLNIHFIKEGGKKLDYLKEIQVHDKKEFYKYVREKLDLSLDDVEKFTIALKDLKDQS